MNLPTARDLRHLRSCIRDAAEFSTCAKAQYFSVIIDTHGHIVGTGYNGSPAGMPHCTDGACPRALNGGTGGSYEDCISIHSEANALLHSNYTARRDGGTLYVNGRPCFSCAKLIANSGLKRVVCLDDGSKRDYPKTDDFLDEAGIALILVTPEEL